MLQKTANDSLFTQQVKALLTKIHSKSVLSDSVYERAIEYFTNQCVVGYQRDVQQQELKALQEKLAKAKEKSIPTVQKYLKKMKAEHKAYENKLTGQRIERHQHIINLCHEVIASSEGESLMETNRKSAKLLATIQLVTPTEGKKIASSNEKNKPLYKAVLALRLLDRLCIDNAIPKYIKNFLSDIKPEQYSKFSEVDPKGYQQFVECVKVPIVFAALIQDIGNYHPDAQKILLGDDGDEDPYRTLALDDRKALLQINYRETVKYLVDGIGLDTYVGNSKEERSCFNQNEREKLLWIKELLKNSIQPKQGSGNLLKVPQIYTSIILSTKPNYNYKLLPKVYQALYQNAERGNCSKGVVDALHQITGDFPQGYGVTFIPLDSDGKKCERYEYAIVNQLYPKKLDQPLCRATTRNLTFIGHGPDIEVSNDNNLYFSETAKSFARISKERLNEILAVLSSNYSDRKNLDLLPRCWHAGDYFSIKENQRLWNLTDN